MSMYTGGHINVFRDSCSGSGAVSKDHIHHTSREPNLERIRWGHPGQCTPVFILMPMCPEMAAPAEDPHPILEPHQLETQPAIAQHTEK